MFSIKRETNDNNVVGFRYATTQDLKRINEFAVDRNLNRALSLEGILALDENGMHVLNQTYVLDDGATLRTEWLIKMKNLATPTIVFIDTAPNDKAWTIINRLPMAFANDTQEV